MRATGKPSKPICFLIESKSSWAIGERWAPMPPIWPMNLPKPTKAFMSSRVRPRSESDAMQNSEAGAPAIVTWNGVQVKSPTFFGSPAFS